MLNSLFLVQFRHHRTFLMLFGWLFQELPAILFLLIVAVPFQPKIRTTTIRLVTVLWSSKEPGGTRAAMILIWMDFIIMGSTHLMPMESIGITGRDITTPPRELRWKLDQFHFKTFYFFPLERFLFSFVNGTQRNRVRYIDFQKGNVDLLNRFYKYPCSFESFLNNSQKSALQIKSRLEIA